MRVTPALICLVCALSALFASPVDAADQAATASAAMMRDGAHDFDFNFGVWKSHITRLLHPLTGSKESMELNGTVAVRKVWGGKAALEEMEADGPQGHWEGMSLFLYDPQNHEWTQTFVNSASGVIAGTLTGAFHDGRGELYSQDTVAGHFVLVRGTWSHISADSHRYEEAYSNDGGKTWETVFAADLTRDKSSRVSAAPALPDRSHDLDFSFGTWKEHSSRLVHPLSGSKEWVEWDGVSAVKKIWGGRANMVELKGQTPSGPLELFALRIYNPAAHQWSLNFATSKVGKLSGTPGVGEFRDGRIDFYDQESIDGKMIFVRFSVWPTSPTTQQSEQAFSADGGKTWEVNWINRYTLVSRSDDAGAAEGAAPPRRQ